VLQLGKVPTISGSTDQRGSRIGNKNRVAAAAAAAAVSHGFATTVYHLSR
jgi:hypothetical protein